MPIKDNIFIIGEVGVNHNGDVNIALEMIKNLADAGADCAKFQTFNAQSLVVDDLSMSPYQYKNTKKMQTQYEMLKNLELSKDEQLLLKNKCESLGLVFLSSPFDMESVDFLEEIGVKYFKIASGEITNLPMLIKIAKTGKTAILSTGMSSLTEVKMAYDILQKNGSKNIYLMHTTTAYPTQYADANLLSLVTLKEKFGEKIGYSDHTKGIIAPLAAIALGAKIIEKHVTLDKNMEGPDHMASIDFMEFKQMVENIRDISVALGNPVKQPTATEIENIYFARKSIFAKKDIYMGELFTEENITTKRPANGISPMKWFEIIGQKSNKNYRKNEMIIF